MMFSLLLLELLLAKLVLFAPELLKLLNVYGGVFGPLRVLCSSQRASVDRKRGIFMFVEALLFMFVEVLYEYDFGLFIVVILLAQPWLLLNYLPKWVFLIK